MLTKDDMLVALCMMHIEDQEFELAEIVDAMEATLNPLIWLTLSRLYFQASRSDLVPGMSWFTLWRDFIIKAMRNY